MSIKQKTKTNWVKVASWMIIYLALLSLGFALGLVYQQVLFVKGATYLLSYSDIEVDINFNETKFMEELNNTFIPIWKEELNQTVNKELNQCKGVGKQSGCY